SRPSGLGPLVVSSSSSSAVPYPVTNTSTTAGETRFTRDSKAALISCITSTPALAGAVGVCAFAALADKNAAPSANQKNARVPSRMLRLQIGMNLNGVYLSVLSSFLDW